MWSKKHTKVQTLCASSSSDNNKTDHNVYIITDDLKSDSDRLCKCLFKKLVEFLVKINLKWKSIIHQIDDFQIKKTVDIWIKISSLSVLNQNQHCYIFIKLDFYFMIDLVFILFVKFLNISFCMRKKHQHVVSDFKSVSKTSSIIYKIYYLWFCIMN